MAYNPYMGYYPIYSAYNQPQNQTYPGIKLMEWVSGKVGADAFSMPSGLPAETPIPLWDSTEKKIYLKSWNNMGMPNPIQELDYEIKERTNPALLPQNISGDNMNQYATKDDLESLKREIQNLSNILNDNNRNNNNRSNNNR